MTETFINALIGGVAIGLSATILLAFNGRIAGISGIFNGAIRSFASDNAWQWVFIFAMVSTALIYRLTTGTSYSVDPFSPWAMIIGGLFVGIGTRWGSGCTSGHGVCGLGRLSLRSLVATLTFMIVGVITVGLIRHVFQW